MVRMLAFMGGYVLVLAVVLYGIFKRTRLRRYRTKKMLVPLSEHIGPATQDPEGGRPLLHQGSL